MQDRTSARSTKPSCNARPDHTLGQTSDNQGAFGLGLAIRGPQPFRRKRRRRRRVKGNPLP